MRATVRAAMAAGVRIGAHPSYPDRENFGRRSLSLPPDALAASLLEQISGLAAIVRQEGGEVAHLKPHGALYNDAARDAELSRIIVEVARSASIEEMLGPPESALAEAARAAGLRFIAEGFADRSYESNGALTPRSEPDAVLSDAADVEANALRMALEGSVIARTGEVLALGIATICLHSDTPGAADHATHIRAALEASGIVVAA